MKKIKDVQTALELFIDAASKHGEATEMGDYKTCNLCYKDIAKTVSYLKENSQLNSLHELLKHGSVGVRLWSATYLLPVHGDEAIRTLNEISRTPGIHSLTAKTTVSEWMNGSLKL